MLTKRNSENKANIDGLGREAARHRAESERARKSHQIEVTKRMQGHVGKHGNTKESRCRESGSHTTSKRYRLVLKNRRGRRYSHLGLSMGCSNPIGRRGRYKS